MKQTLFLRILPLLIAVFVIGCPGTESPIPGTKEKAELTAGQGVDAEANDTSATVIFTGATGLTLTAADFTVSNGATISNVSVSADTVTVTVNFGANSGNAQITYTVSIAASSTKIKGSATVQIIQGFVGDTRVLLTAGQGVDADADDTSAAVTFTGASELELTVEDFTVSEGAAISNVSVSGETVTITVTFDKNSTDEAITYTVGINPESTTIRGSAKVRIIQDFQGDIRIELTAGNVVDVAAAATSADVTFSADADTESNLDDLDLGAADFIVVSGEGATIGTVSVSGGNEIATVTVTVNFDENTDPEEKTYVIGIASSSTKIKGHTQQVTITQAGWVDLRAELTAGEEEVAVDADAISADVTFTGAAGLDLTEADFTVSGGAEIDSVSVSGDTVTVKVTFDENTGTEEIEYIVGINLGSTKIKGDATVTIIQDFQDDPLIELATDSHNVSAEAAASSANVIFTATSSLEGLGLSAADFEVVSGDATIGAVSVSGSTVTVTVNFTANTGAVEKTYTVGIASSSTKIQGHTTVTITHKLGAIIMKVRNQAASGDTTPNNDSFLVLTKTGNVWKWQGEPVTVKNNGGTLAGTGITNTTLLYADTVPTAAYTLTAKIKFLSSSNGMIFGLAADAPALSSSAFLNLLGLRVGANGSAKLYFRTTNLTTLEPDGGGNTLPDGGSFNAQTELTYTFICNGDGTSNTHYDASIGIEPFFNTKNPVSGLATAITGTTASRYPGIFVYGSEIEISEITLTTPDTRAALTAGTAVTVNAGATSTDVTFTGAEGLAPLAAADFTVPSNAQIGTVTTNGGTVTVPVTFAGNMDNAARTYSVRANPNSAKIKGTASVKITHNVRKTLTVPQATVTAAANETNAVVTFTGASGLAQGDLLAADFTVSSGVSIQGVNISGDNAVVTVSFAGNEGSASKIYTVGINSASVHVTGSANVQIIHDYAGDTRTELAAGPAVNVTASETTAQVTFTGASGLSSLLNSDFTVSPSGSVTNVGVTGNTATVTVNIGQNTETSPKTYTVGINIDSATIKGAASVTVIQASSLPPIIMKIKNQASPVVGETTADNASFITLTPTSATTYTWSGSINVRNEGGNFGNSSADGRGVTGSTLLYADVVPTNGFTLEAKIKVLDSLGSTATRGMFFGVIANAPSLGSSRFQLLTALRVLSTNSIRHTWFVGTSSNMGTTSSNLITLDTLNTDIVYRYTCTGNGTAANQYSGSVIYNGTTTGTGNSSVASGFWASGVQRYPGIMVFINEIEISEITLTINP